MTGIVPHDEWLVRLAQAFLSQAYASDPLERQERR
jgi:hypothetical protein